MFSIGTLLSGIGSAIGIGGQFRSASQARQTGQLNYQIDAANAESRRSATLAALQLQGLRSQLSLTEASMNARLGLAEAEMRRRNAERLESFAEARTTQGRVAVRRARRNFEELAGRQMGAIATSGVLASGSPLDVMADTAGQMALALADMWTETAMERSDILSRATQERFAASTGAITARAGLTMARSSARVDRAGLALARSAAQAEYRSALFGAGISRSSANDSARGATLAGLGGIFAGGAAIASDFNTNRRLGA